MVFPLALVAASSPKVFSTWHGPGWRPLRGSAASSSGAWLAASFRARPRIGSSTASPHLGLRACAPRWGLGHGIAAAAVFFPEETKPKAMWEEKKKTKTKNMTKKGTDSNLTKTQVMVAYSLAAAAAVGCLWVLPPIAVFQWLSMAAFGFAIYGPQTLITMTGVETVPPKAAATAGGLLAYPAQFGSIAAGLPFALLVQNYGWGGFFPCLITLSLISAAVVLPGLSTPSYRQLRRGWKK